MDCENLGSATRFLLALIEWAYDLGLMTVTWAYDWGLCRNILFEAKDKKEW